MKELLALLKKERGQILAGLVIAIIIALVSALLKASLTIIIAIVATIIWLLCIYLYKRETSRAIRTPKWRKKRLRQEVPQQVSYSKFIQRLSLVGIIAIPLLAVT